MIVISDTNILSSMAAGNSVHLLSHLFPRSKICIPPAVHAELLAGLARGKTHLVSILQAIAADKIEILSISIPEEQLSQSLPSKLNIGEREAIALSQSRKVPLLSNDKQVIRYCQQQGLRIFDLSDILRLLWIRQIISQPEVKTLIEAMVAVEKLTLSPKQSEIIFAPYPRQG